MKKINLFKEIITTDRTALMQAFNSAKAFGITHDGRVVYAPFEPSDIFIYQGSSTTTADNTAPKALSLQELLGSNYKAVEDGERVLIKAAAAWQELININTERADYDDTTGDGIAEFSDSELEEIGWHATEFSIGYREMVDVIEKQCDGVLLCIEQEEPYQFSGLGFIGDRECARKRLFEYCKERAETVMKEDDDFAPENLTDDEKEAAVFFGLL